PAGRPRLRPGVHRRLRPAPRLRLRRRPRGEQHPRRARLRLRALHPARRRRAPPRVLVAGGAGQGGQGRHVGRLLGGGMRRQVAVLALLLVAARAGAVEYEVPIEIDTDDDLYELLTTEQISEDTFNALLDLYQRGIDLNEADAEE